MLVKCNKLFYDLNARVEEACSDLCFVCMGVSDNFFFWRELTHNRVRRAQNKFSASFEVKFYF